jgi:hypothetical protein
VVGEPVEQGGSRLGVAEHGRLFAEGQVGRHDDRGSLVEPADEVEEELAAGLGERQVAKLVEDDEIEAGKELKAENNKLKAENDSLKTEGALLQAEQDDMKTAMNDMQEDIKRKHLRLRRQPDLYDARNLYLYRSDAMCLPRPIATDSPWHRPSGHRGHQEGSRRAAGIASSIVVCPGISMRRTFFALAGNLWRLCHLHQPPTKN